MTWYAEVAANRSSARVKSDLRSALTEHVAAVGPGGLAEDRTGELAVLATDGIDALDGYFTRYLPQLVLAVIVPLVVLVAVLSQDWISAAIIAVTVPLIPLFMVLIGMATRHATGRRMRALQQLAGHFLDVVAGLTTLKMFGRSKAQVRTIREVTATYRRRPWPRCGWPSSRHSCSSCWPASPWPSSPCPSGCASCTATSTCARRCSCSSSLRRRTCHCATSARPSTPAPTASAPPSRCSACSTSLFLHGAPGPTCPTRHVTSWSCAS